MDLAVFSQYLHTVDGPTRFEKRFDVGVLAAGLAACMHCFHSWRWYPVGAANQRKVWKFLKFDRPDLLKDDEIEVDHSDPWCWD